MNSNNPANEFLSTILFIDDDADKNNKKSGSISFDFNKFASEFAKKGKLCTLYSPKSMDDISICIEMAKKADVTVLDWGIYFPISNEIASTEDVASDTRGEFSIQILTSVLRNCRNQLKLFLIYTNESIYHVYQDIKEKLKDSGLTPTDCIEKDHLLIFNSVRIYFRKKNISDIEEKNQQDLLTAEQVPSFLLDKFINMNNGFLPEFALKCATLIKENIFEILNQFSKDMDYAYFDHKSCTIDIDSSLDILFSIYSNVLSELLLSQSDNFSLLEEKWLKIYIDTISDNCKEKQNIKRLLGIESFSSNKEHDDKVANACKNHPVAHSLLNDETKLLESFIKFAKLSHICVEFSINEDKPQPLSLGTIIQDKSNSLFYLCIQQRCDSVRINGGERKFLFLPLSKKCIKELNLRKQNITVILDRDMTFELKSKSFDIHTIIFSTSNSIIEPKKINDEWIYSDKTNKQYKYCGRVNEIHSLRIARKYAETLSRIGLDDFEWFRILGEK